MSTNYDLAGRISQVSGVKGAVGTTYASGFSYTAHGAVASMTLGNGLIESTTFNNRLQPTNISLGSLLSLAYNYGASNSNGNVLSITTTPGVGQTPLSQTFLYDTLNRLQSGTETVSGSQTWKQSNGFDQYGNRWMDSLNTTGNVMGPISSQADVSAANNRIQKAGYAYDAAGNMTAEPGKTYTFDGENKIVTANVTGAVSTYVYDGEGRRVKKTTPSGTSVMVYDASSLLVAEYSDAPSAGPGGTQYATADHLGTPRLWTNQQGAVISRHDYLPFGEELFSGLGGRSTGQGYAGSTQVDGQRKQFTQKERDNETNLDYFLARYYSSGAGRFTSPDEFTGGPDDLFDFADLASANPTFYADLTIPQSLNKYQYAYNNPLRYVDPNGHMTDDPDHTISNLFFATAATLGISAGVSAAASAGVITAPATLPAAGVLGGLSGIAAVLGGISRVIENITGGPQPITIPSSQAQPAPQTTTPPTTQAQPLAPPAPIQASKSKAQPAAPPLTGPDKAKADRERKKSDKRTKEEKKKDRQDRAKNKSKKTDDHTGEGPHHRDPTQGGRRGPRPN